MIIDGATLGRFRELIGARAGLVLREQETPLLTELLRARTQALHISRAAAYLDFLDQADLAAQSEWKQLWILLTNQESYFFRDAEQLSVIRDHLLPEILQRNRESRTLRVWSAGCSTGEEPYSLAMMFDEMPALRDWRVTIVGTDISEAALQRAQRGVYGAWSFRALEDQTRARFFRVKGRVEAKEWEIAPQLRHKVVFASNNLFGDEFPARHGELHDIDIIVCRNVFIYFGRDAVAQVLPKFGATLRPGGFLVCGHAELHDMQLGDFQARVFPQSVIYQLKTIAKTAPFPAVPPISQRTAGAVTATASFDRNMTPGSYAAAAPPSRDGSASATCSSVTSARSDLKAPRLAPRRAATFAFIQPDATPGTAQNPNRSARAQATVVSVPLSSRDSLASSVQPAPEKPVAEKETLTVTQLCLKAQVEADAGQLDAAETSCARALALSPFAALPYQLWARVAEERGDAEVAKSLLKKVIYLNPRSVWGTLELSAIYARQGDAARAAQMRRAALELLEELGESLGDAAPVPVEEHAVETPLSIGELKRQLLAEWGAAR